MGKTRRQLHLERLKNKRSANVGVDDEGEETSEGEEDMKTEAAATFDKPDPINFGDPLMLNYIADVFQLCKSKCGLKNISCLLYMTLRHFGKSWDECNDFLTNVGAYTCMRILYLSASRECIHLIFRQDFTQMDQPLCEW